MRFVFTLLKGIHLSFELSDLKRDCSVLKMFTASRDKRLMYFLVIVFVNKIRQITLIDLKEKVKSTILVSLLLVESC